MKIHEKIQQFREKLAQKTLETELTAKVSSIHFLLEELSIEIDLLHNEIIPEADTILSRVAATL